MKLQSLSIIFIIIIFPVILAISYYLGLQIDTITLQNKYNNALIDATNDAMEAFEMNTANEDLSQVSDSLRTIIDASTNTFMNTFATSLGMSNTNKENIQPYIPSILYTMYDGYYIYAPTKTPIILEKKVTVNGITTSDGYAVVGDEGVVQVTGGYRYIPGAPATFDVDDVGALLYKVQGNDVYTTQINVNTEYKTDYVLKSYMPYAATYQDGGNIATINYTLDNYISISAKIGNIYYTKSGYYIDSSKIKNITVTDQTTGTAIDISSCTQDDIREICLNVNNTISIDIVEKDLSSVNIQVSGSEDDKRKAIAYYLTNMKFSEWVNDNLDFVNGDNLETVINFANPETMGYSTEYLEAMYHNFAGEGKVFEATIDPEIDDSPFNNHKYNIMKNSIQYNLNLSISSYNQMFQGITFEMPLIEDERFEELTRKISIVSFAQGMDCGLKTYNGYAIISSTNNEMTVLPEEIYYVPYGKENDEDSTYHRLDCPDIPKDPIITDYDSFKSKDVKYDDIYKGDTANPKYEYDHKNLACYNCIVQNNYSNYQITQIGAPPQNERIKLRAFLGLEDDENLKNDSPNLTLRKAYYIAVAKERQNLYKTTGYSKNEGINIDNTGNEISWIDNRIRAEVTLNSDEIKGSVGRIYIAGTPIDKYISLATKTNQTIEISKNETVGGKIQCYIEKPDGTTEEVPVTISAIKYIYK